MIKVRHFMMCSTIISTLSMMGCGGGGSGDSSSATTKSAAEGLWIGTTADSRQVIGLIFENGLYYVLYSASGDYSTIAGVIQGNGETSGANFSSTNTKDFSIEGNGINNASFSASFSSRSTLSGTINYGAGVTNTFTSNYDNDYDVIPTISALVGTYSGTVASSAGNENASVTIAADGAFTGSATSGCNVSGTIVPRSRGNAYVVSLTFGGSPCLLSHQTLSGIGYYDSTNKRLYSATPNASRSDGVLFVGTKP